MSELEPSPSQRCAITDAGYTVTLTAFVRARGPGKLGIRKCDRADRKTGAENSET